MEEEALLKVIGDYSVEVANLKIKLAKEEQKVTVLSQRLEKLEKETAEDELQTHE